MGSSSISGVSVTPIQPPAVLLSSGAIWGEGEGFLRGSERYSFNGGDHKKVFVIAVLDASTWPLLSVGPSFSKHRNRILS